MVLSMEDAPIGLYSLAKVTTQNTQNETRKLRGALLKRN